MKSKKFFSSLFVTALLAGVIAFYSCSKDNVDGPADDGKKLAQELCDSFTKAVTDADKVASIEAFESKAQKWQGEDAEAFIAAFNQQIANCGATTPHQWYSTYLGKTAAQELCQGFAAATGATPQELFNAQMGVMIGMQMKYAGRFRDEEGQGGDPLFEDAFSDEFMGGCSNIPDWFICMWTGVPCAEFLTTEQLQGLGAKAGQDLCAYFRATTDNEETQQKHVFEVLMFEYRFVMGIQSFRGAFSSAFMSCRNDVPAWFFQAFGGGGSDGGGPCPYC